ncbi:MAG: hypothetical protein HYU36_18505 [Planctomycetes bacterium]|nr:hypothetical protein [Planctomycetota bacterium]
MPLNLAFLALFINGLIAAKAVALVSRAPAAWALFALALTLAIRSLAGAVTPLGMHGEGLALGALVAATILCFWAALHSESLVRRGPWLASFPILAMLAGCLDACFHVLPHPVAMRSYPPADWLPWAAVVLPLSILAALPRISHFRLDEWVPYRTLLPLLLLVAWLGPALPLSRPFSPALALEAWCELGVLVMVRTTLRHESLGRLPMFLLMVLIPALAGTWAAVRLHAAADLPAPAIAALAAGLAGLVAAVLAVLLRDEIETQIARLFSPNLQAAQERTRQLELELLAARAALRQAEREAVLGEVVLSVAHQIKNPLGPMKGYAQMLARDLEQVGTMEQRERMDKGLRIILSEIDRIDRQVKELMTFAGRRPPRRDRVDLNRLIERAVLFAAPERTGVAVALHLEANPSSIIGDFDRLHEAFLNLILNAVEAMAGSIRQHLTVSSCLEENGVLVRVVDTGVGIPSEDRDRIFEPFFSRRNGGFGLGLPIARSAIQECGGRLTCRSEVGVGTEFAVWLPISCGKEVKEVQ